MEERPGGARARTMIGLELFSGIGGFRRALERHGVDVRWGCDNDPFVSALYTQRFGSPVISDVREIDASLGEVHVVAGGFPCQPASLAGKGLAQEDERWLWPEFERVIGELRPRWVFIENVPGLRRRGMVDVLRGLARLGYDADWDGVPAAAVGAPHLRDRLWIVAWPREHAPISDTWTMFGSPLEDAEHFRAGALRDGEVHEAEPIAPVKIRREGQWSYWAGVQLGEPMGLLPTAAARDWKDGSTVGRMGRSQLPEAVRGLEADVLLPTAAAVSYGSSQNGLNGVNGAKRRPPTASPSLDTIARRDLWPTAKASPSGPDYARVGPADSGGDDLATAVARVEPGPLSPAWVDWFMGFPSGWTDPNVANAELPVHDWRLEPLPRVLRDVPYRKQRLTALGNALVSDAAEVFVRRALYVPAR